MNDVLDAFEGFLTMKKMLLSKTVMADEIIYSGKLKMEGGHLVPFGILIYKTDLPLLEFQIVFSNLKESTILQNAKVYQTINQINCEGIGYYYLYIDENEQVSLRTVSNVKRSDYEMIYDIFLAGVRSVKYLSEKL